MRFAPTPCRRDGFWIRPRNTVCASWSACPGSSTLPFWKTDSGGRRLPRVSRRGSRDARGIRPFSATPWGMKSRRPSYAGTGGAGSKGSSKVCIGLVDGEVRAAFSAGCAGAFVFAWTDEWHRGGTEIEDWDFGLTTRERRPKPALAVVSRAFAEVPFPPDTNWPRISVIVCTYNGARTFRETMERLKELDYPDYEVPVGIDGSTDHTADIAREYDVTLISTENNGLSHARTVGRKAAGGEVLAYIDDDAYPR